MIERNQLKMPNSFKRIADAGVCSYVQGRAVGGRYAIVAPACRDRLMRKQFGTLFHRRDLFRAALAAAATTATGALTPTPATAAPTGSPDKRRARYQADSAEVENFYRVNRYPAR
jgi:hypothetical protein